MVERPLGERAGDCPALPAAAALLPLGLTLGAPAALALTLAKFVTAAVPLGLFALNYCITRFTSVGLAPANLMNSAPACFADYSIF